MGSSTGEVSYQLVSGLTSTDASKTVTFTINKKAATVAVCLSPSTITVGDALPIPIMSYGGVVSGDSLTTSETPVSIGMPGDSSTAGIYTIGWDNVAVNITGKNVTVAFVQAFVFSLF